MWSRPRSDSRCRRTTSTSRWRSSTARRARQSAVEELQAAGTFDDLTSLDPGQDDVDRQLDQLGAKSAVDDELAKLKADLGAGGKRPALPGGEPAGGSAPESAQLDAGGTPSTD
jgi:phage shock protein A